MSGGCGAAIAALLLPAAVGFGVGRRWGGAGGDRGPPLVFDTCDAGPRTDAAFVAVARSGVRRHHWRFGDMPARCG